MDRHRSRCRYPTGTLLAFAPVAAPLAGLRVAVPFCGLIIVRTLTKMRDTCCLVHTSILTDEFAQAASQAGLRARQTALAAGHPVVFVDAAGRCVEEWPNGKRFEIRLDPSHPRESHRIVLRELASNAA